MSPRSQQPAQRAALMQFCSSIELLLCFFAHVLPFFLAGSGRFFTAPHQPLQFINPEYLPFLSLLRCKVFCVRIPDSHRRSDQFLMMPRSLGLLCVCHQAAAAAAAQQQQQHHPTTRAHARANTRANTRKLQLTDPPPYAST